MSCVIDGPTGSGKTRRLLSTMSHCKLIDDRVLFVDFKTDTPKKLTDDVSTVDVLVIDNLSTAILQDQTDDVVNCINKLADSGTTRVYVAIDTSAENSNSSILSLIRHCDKYERLHGYCIQCGNCTPAHFTSDRGSLCRSHASLGTGTLTITFGPMFSGKSSSAIDTLRKLRFANCQTLAVNHAMDTRYGEKSICSHDAVKEECLAVHNLEDVCTHASYPHVNAIIMEEAQFFTGLKDVVLRCLRDGKHVYLFGLNGDFRRERFGELVDLVPFAEKVNLLSALCKLCKDGTPAIYSKRIVHSSSQIQIGTSDTYIPVCRRHF